MNKNRSGILKLTVVTPIFNEADNFDHYVERIRSVLFEAPDLKISVVLVDDGSSDESWQKIQKLSDIDERFLAIRLSRNFGVHTALTAGFDHVPLDADIVATLACDLQDPAETILSFIKAWRGGADIVWGARRSRKDGIRRGVGSQVLMKVLRRYAMPKNSKFQAGSFFLIDRIVLDCLRQFREHGRVTFALVAWTGFEQAIVQYDRKARVTGRSGWSYMQMLNTAYDVLIGFSPIPAKALTAFGFFMLGGSALFFVHLVLSWIFFDVQPGWTGLMATMTLCFGLLFVMIGISFEYLYRIFVETKQRPLYFVAARSAQISERPSERAPLHWPKS